MKTFTLTAKMDNETGELGYLIEGTPIIQYPMVANESSLIAHDLLEHVNGLGKIGSLDDELEALAGVWFIRGQHGNLRRDGGGSRYTPQDNIASDVLNMARIYNNGVNFRTKVPKTKACSEDDNFNEIIQKAKDDVCDEIDSDDINQARLDVYFNACLHYMRKGWAKVQRRFKRYSSNQFYANNLFWNIEQALRDYMQPYYEGQQLKLSINYAECECFVDEFFEDNY
jgi:hypothetical protein